MTALRQQTLFSIINKWRPLRAVKMNAFMCRLLFFFLSYKRLILYLGLFWISHDSIQSVINTKPNNTDSQCRRQHLWDLTSIYIRYWYSMLEVWVQMGFFMWDFKLQHLFLGAIQYLGPPSLTTAMQMTTWQQFLIGSTPLHSVHRSLLTSTATGASLATCMACRFVVLR